MVNFSAYFFPIKNKDADDYARSRLPMVWSSRSMMNVAALGTLVSFLTVTLRVKFRIC